MRVAALCGVLLLLSLSARADTRRFALVVGNNAGSGDLPPLRYAETDAGKVARVLVELGQVAPDDLLLLQGRPLSEIEAALQAVQSRTAEAHRAPDARALVLFFFSGHSDGMALEIGAERLTFAKLKAALVATGAEVRVAIIDSCRSGSAILEKGGRPAAPFTLRLTDEITASGEAMITSSAADEAALESKEMMGSFFTHHLVSGLRGAADASGDRQVTLAEAYRYAYDHTISSTSATIVGAQHPTYDYRLSGQGELVLTSLEKPSASLELPPGFERAVVTDLNRDQVVAELSNASSPRVALSPGVYGVKLFRGGKPYGGRFRLDGAKVVAWDELAATSAPVAARKGAELQAPARGEGRPTLLGISLGGSGTVTSAVGVVGSIRLDVSPSAAAGLSLSLAGTTGTGSGPAGTFSESALFLHAGYQALADFGQATVVVGGELGPGAVWQVLGSGDSPGTFAVSGGPRAQLRLHVSGPVLLTAGAELMIGVLKVSDHLTAKLLPAAHVGLGFEI